MGNTSLDDRHGWRRRLGTIGVRIVGNLMGCVAALQFLTIAPLLIRRPFRDEELGRSVGFFPLVGLLIGGFLAAFNHLVALFLPPGLAAALVLTGWIVCTGALHLDGFLDTCDGLLGGRTPEDRLRILRDPRVGAFGVIGGILLLLVKFQCLTAIHDRNAALYLAPVLGRWAMAVAVVAFPYARKEGVGRTLKDRAGWRQAVLATIIALVVAWIVAGWLGLTLLLLSGPFMSLIVRFALSRLPGLTGDLYGAICELVEALVLLVFVANGER